MVMQALAIYDEPTLPSAVDLLLMPFIPGIESGSILQRLKEAQFIIEEDGGYRISSEYSEYALSRIPDGELANTNRVENPPFSKYSLYYLAAEYYKIIRLEEEGFTDLAQLHPQVQEIIFRTKAADYNEAAAVMEHIYGYLTIWGHYSLIIALLEPLIDKIRGYDIVSATLYSLGNALMENTQYYEAIDYFGQALDLSQKHSVPYHESLFNGLSGDCYTELGKTDIAFGFYSLALDIDHELIKETKVEEYPIIGEHHCKVGQCYFKIGSNIVYAPL
jgi:tetratricopeptide (TPR) repeat protein